MRYSIVIPTYNRKKTLQMTLDSTIVQTILPSEYEIIVVDDGSIDGTRSVVEEFIEKHPARAIRYFWQENGGPAKARNFGIKES
ncbi:MAG: glycosyltransferase family A protein, partial [Patescibacteria group bacterium]